MRLTKQGVRDLNDPPKNKRAVPQSATCMHEFEHDRECTGCWAEQFGGFDRASHHYKCRKCPQTRLE